MEYQVRISYETAEMLNQLKECYENDKGINFTKGDVVTQAIFDTRKFWDKVNWDSIKVDVKHYEMLTGAVRPKIRVATEVDAQIRELREIISKYLGMSRFISVGVAFKYLFRLALSKIQLGKVLSVETVLTETLNDFLVSDDYDDELKKVVRSFFNTEIKNLKENKLIK